MGANVEDRGMKEECTPLMEVSIMGYTEIVKLFLAHGADPNAKTMNGEHIGRYCFVESKI